MASLSRLLSVVIFIRVEPATRKDGLSTASVELTAKMRRVRRSGLRTALTSGSRSCQGRVESRSMETGNDPAACWYSCSAQYVGDKPVPPATGNKNPDPKLSIKFERHP